MLTFDVSLEMGCDVKRLNARVCLDSITIADNPTQENVISSIGTDSVSVKSVDLSF